MTKQTASSKYSPQKWLLLFCLVCDSRVVSAFFLPKPPPAWTTPTTMPLKKCQSIISSSSRTTATRHYYHPAVEGWEQKYIDAGGRSASGGADKEQKTISSSSASSSDDDKLLVGPRLVSTEFEVHAATETELSNLDVKHWPVWTTGDKEKWSVGNQIVDKEMPYGELSYVISGKLEIIPSLSSDNTTGDSSSSVVVPVIVSVGDFVTFPKGFVASWKVLEELTWNYYLY